MSLSGQLNISQEPRPRESDLREESGVIEHSLGIAVGVRGSKPGSDIPGGGGAGSQSAEGGSVKVSIVETILSLK